MSAKPLPSLGLGVITYNSMRHLDQCLESIMVATEGLDVVRVVVDNGSTDGTVERLLEHWADRFLLVLRDDNPGYAAAVNTIARVAPGEVFCILNPDLVLEADALRVGLEYLRDHPEVGLVGANLYGGGKGAIVYGFLPTPWRLYYTNTGLRRIFPVKQWRMGLDLPAGTTEPFEVGYPCGAFWLVRRTAWEEVGPFDERFFLYFEETDWATRAHQTKWKVLVHPGVKAMHEGGGSTGSELDSQITMFTRYFRSAFLYLAKHYGVAQARKTYRALRRASRNKQFLLKLKGIPEEIRQSQRILYPAIEAVAEFVASDALSGDKSLVLREPHRSEGLPDPGLSEPRT